MQLSVKSPTVVIAGGAVVIVLALTAIWWVFSDSTNVLFDHLLPAQLNSTSAELDRAGIDYKIDREKSAIVVAEKDARRARLLLAGGGNALHDSTGFELFDKSDFGMTDFAQKINYQRAMEGEIARTISALAEIKYARVHLVLPDHTLFHSERQKPRASVTVFLNADASLSGEQVKSIQRIAASAVPDLAEQDVTVINQSGMTLSSAMEGDDQTVSSPARLQQKRAVESYMADKVRKVLEKAVGANHFAVSIDVGLDMNQKTTTTEKVLDGGADTGIKRIKASTSHGRSDAGTEDNSKEVEYALGRESEQVVHAIGEVKHIQVGVIIDNDVEGVDLAKLRELIATAAGIDAARGDKVAVVQNNIAVQKVMQQIVDPTTAISEASSGGLNRISGIVVAFLGGIVAAVFGVVVVRGNRQRSLQLKEVQQLRRQLQQWVDGVASEVKSL